jgi:transcriptional/translational regulatory protein YebC/TACO1
VATPDRMFEAAVEAGADNVESDADGHRILCAPDDLNTVRDALERDFGPPSAAKLVWKPKTVTAVEGDTAESLIRLLETLEDSDDVQNVYANFEMSDEAMARLSA